MKNCPFCAEEIQDNAIKCKHCGEWLDKRNSIKEAFNRTKAFVEKRIEERNQEKTKHLYVPTLYNPLIIECIRVYPDRLQIDNKEYPFNRIKNIVFHSGSATYNFVTVSDYTTFHLYVASENDNENDICIKIMCWLDNNEALIKSTAGKKVKEQVALMYRLISQSTFNNRLANYLKEIYSNKSFKYADLYTIHENGDVYKQEKYKDNIKKAFQEERLEWGTTWEGLKSYSFNPYEFTMYKNPGGKVSLFGIELSKKTKISTTVDHDIFNILIISFLEKGSFFAFEELNPKEN